jgi:hypothetical protein
LISVAVKKMPKERASCGRDDALDAVHDESAVIGHQRKSARNISCSLTMFKDLFFRVTLTLIWPS